MRWYNIIKEKKKRGIFHNFPGESIAEDKGKSFYIVDDIYATGNTMKAIKKTIEELGGIVKGQGVIMNIKELNNDTDIYSLLDINES